MSPPKDLRTNRNLGIPCYKAQILSPVQDVIIFNVERNIMPFTIFYNFFGCTVPTISSCFLKDNSNFDQSGGIILDISA